MAETDDTTEAAAAATADGAAGKALLALNGSSQAAVLLMALGEEEAASVLQHMEPGEVQALGSAMAAIKGVSQEQIRATLDQFVDRIKNESSLGIGSGNYLKTTLTRALGEERARNMLSRIPGESDERGLTALKWMDARTIAKVIRNEHPQVIATVLGQLEREQAGAVLNLLPESMLADVVFRISQLDAVHPQALEELDELIQDLFASNSDLEVSGIGGVRVASEILNSVSRDREDTILDAIGERDSELSEKIREGMFIFDNLMAVDDRGMQTMLREVSNDNLVIALKGAAVELQQKIFKNMSKRAAELLQDDLSAKGPVKLAEVEAAQKEILLIAQRLADEGTIALGGKGDDYV